MNRPRVQIRRDRATNAVLLTAIIVTAGVIILPHLGPGPPITLNILSTFDYQLIEVIEEAFLRSSYAVSNRITDMRWMGTSDYLWDAYAKSGDFDIAWGHQSYFSMIEDTALEPILEQGSALDAADSVGETLAGRDLKGTFEGHVSWVSPTVIPEIYYIIYNDALFDEYGLSAPYLWDDLYDPMYNTMNTSAFSALPNLLNSTEHAGFMRFMINSGSWTSAWQDVTVLASRSVISNSFPDSMYLFHDGEVACTTCRSGTIIWEQIPHWGEARPFGTRAAMDVEPMAVLSGSENKEAAWAFFEFILSDEGQSLFLDEDLRKMPVREIAFGSHEQGYIQIMHDLYDHLEVCTTIEDQPTEFAFIGSAMSLYFNATVTSIHQELRNTWNQLASANLNGSLNYTSFRSLANTMGEPLSVNDPESGTLRIFDPSFAYTVYFRIVSDMDSVNDLWLAWRTAALDRLQSILDCF